jgi:hypothetical protein
VCNNANYGVGCMVLLFPLSGRILQYTESVAEIDKNGKMSDVSHPEWLPSLIFGFVVMCDSKLFFFLPLILPSYRDELFFFI